MSIESQRIRKLIDGVMASVDTLNKEFDVLYPPEPTQMGIYVNAGANLQHAYDQLFTTGGIITLAPGMHTPLVLGERPLGARLITITSDSANLPEDGERITPEFAEALGIIRATAPTTSPILCKNKSRNVALVNVGIAPPETKSYVHVYMGGDQNSMKLPEDRPTGFLFDRVYVYGDPVLGAHCGVVPNARDVSIINSYFKDIFEIGRDSQAVCSTNGGQNILLENNYFEAGAENVMFGGSDSASPEMTSQDIIIRDCEFSKNYEWMYLVKQPSIKALFEIKNVKRLLMERCLLQNNWARDWPTGVAITLKACNGLRDEVWATCEDVMLRDLVIRNVGSVFSQVGKNDSSRTSDWMRRVSIKNVLAYNINVDKWKGTGRFCPFINGCEGFYEMDHITVHTNQHSWMQMGFGQGITKSPGVLRLTNSIVAESEYGYISELNGVGFGAAAKDWTGIDISGNVFKAGVRGQGPVLANNLRLTPEAWDVSIGPDHKVIAGSPASQVKTTDGKLPGADIVGVF